MNADIQRDEGMANERTALAWWRTALATVVAAGLILRGASGTAEVVVVGGMAAGALAVVLIVASRRSRALAAQHRDAPASVTTVPVAVALLVLQVIALVVVL